MLVKAKQILKNDFESRVIIILDKFWLIIDHEFSIKQFLESAAWINIRYFLLNSIKWYFDRNFSYFNKTAFKIITKFSGVFYSKRILIYNFDGPSIISVDFYHTLYIINPNEISVFIIMRFFLIDIDNTLLLFGDILDEKRSGLYAIFIINFELSAEIIDHIANSSQNLAVNQTDGSTLLSQRFVQFVNLIDLQTFSYYH